jgi:hypothetical protein
MDKNLNRYHYNKILYILNTIFDRNLRVLIQNDPVLYEELSNYLYQASDQLYYNI